MIDSSAQTYTSEEDLSASEERTMHLEPVTTPYTSYTIESKFKPKFRKIKKEELIIFQADYLFSSQSLASSTSFASIALLMQANPPPTAPHQDSRKSSRELRRNRRISKLNHDPEDHNIQLRWRFHRSLHIRATQRRYTAELHRRATQRRYEILTTATLKS